MAASTPAGGGGGSFSILPVGVLVKDLAMPLMLVAVLGLMIVPLPTMALDFLLAVNVTIALMVLLTAIQVSRPLDLSVFPSLLLVTTLFRLALNVSTTRLILLDGANGTEAAGQIIETFGSFVVGGSYLVGIVVFLVLTLINFIVITRGSGRIAEVGARFTLDALPGKQMSIDSDLAAGLITQDEARRRRVEVASETDFYGAMDGASKFVRGDAIAGLVITGINILGGLIIGVAQQDMSLADAAETYTVLTIGDGLVSQIPALLISTAAGVVVTRSTDAADLGGQLVDQLLRNPRVLVASTIVLVALALVPGMPWPMLLGLAAGLFWLSRRSQVRKTDGDGRPSSGPGAAHAGPAPPTPSGEGSDGTDIERMLPVEALELEVGYGLVPLVDAREGGEVVGRINRLRQNFARDMGVILPPVHIKDNLELGPGEYRLMIHGVESARGDVMADRVLAMDPGDVRDPVDGITTVEPAFGLPALWIRPADKGRAELAGYTVVEPAAVMITHLSEVLQRDADKLLSREDMQTLLDVAARRSPRVVDEVVPGVLGHAEVLAVLRALLRERVSIRDLPAILEALGEAARFGKTVPFLVDQVRLRLGPAVVQALLGMDGRLHVAMMDAASEDLLRTFVVRNEADVSLAPDLANAQTLLAQLQSGMERLQQLGHHPLLIAPSDLRYPLWRFAARFLPLVHVMAQNELPPRVEVATDHTITLSPRGRGPRAAQRTGGAAR